LLANRIPQRSLFASNNEASPSLLQSVLLARQYDGNNDRASVQKHLCFSGGFRARALPLTPALSLREREQSVPADAAVSSCSERSPLPPGEG